MSTLRCSKLNSFEWQIWAQLQKLGLSKDAEANDRERIQPNISLESPSISDNRKPHVGLIALSGGVDSVVLAAVMLRLAARLDLQVKTAHIHHGLSDSAALNEYRTAAQQFCRRWADDHNLEFFTNGGDALLRPQLKVEPSAQLNAQSEAQLRAFRFAKLAELKVRSQAEFLILGHNHDDLFETRLLRLIRGTDAQGLQAMEAKTGNLLRPLLHMTRAQIEEYASSQQLQWIEDPSNQQSDYLRNWLRREWLPALEQRMPGATHRLAASLEGLADHLSTDSTVDLASFLVAENELDLREFLTLSPKRQAQVMALFLKHLGVKDYTRGQIAEILKRLDSISKVTTFEIAGYLWATNAQRISALKITKR